jgi:hypothetical protein
LESDDSWNQYSIPNAGSHTVRTANVRKSILLNKGDRLALRLQRDIRRTGLVVPSLADVQTKVEAKYRKQVDDVQLTLLAERTTSPLGGGTYFALDATLEKPNYKVSFDGELFRKRPPLAWFTIEPIFDNFKGKIPVTVTEINGQLAPIWEVRALNWPARDPRGNARQEPARYRLNSYWVDRAISYDWSIKIPRLRDLKSSQFTPEPPQGMAIEMTLRDNPRAPGTWLYVRCSHPAGAPVLLQLRPNNVFSSFTDQRLAEEQRYYPEANSVSAWFDVTQFVEKDEEFAVDLYSLAKILQAGDTTTKIEYESANPIPGFNRMQNRTWRDSNMKEETR